MLQTIHLAKGFEEATAYAKLKISSLDINKMYPIVGAKRMTTKYGPNILLSIRESDAGLVQIFSYKRYFAVISNDDMDKINSKAVSLNPNHTYWE